MKIFMVFLMHSYEFRIGWIEFVPKIKQILFNLRYGDFVPTTNSSKVLMIIWVLVGLVTMGVITGVISSGMTVDGVEGELKLYGTKV